MKTIITLSSLIIIGAIILSFVLGHISKSKTPPGLASEGLSKCPSKPNCVCSEESKDTKHYIEPISYSTITDAEIMQHIISVLTQMDGSIISKSDTYIAATFTSPIFGFVDDFEIRLDNKKRLIHIRSASRVGYSDMNANRKRTEVFRKKIAF